ncbi:DNA-directed RNA polymerase sigma-70 factor [Parapedobacter defluvii]|uniref:DNA-directed RNA polymerase sigma-70 factor n=1 Tax=Parapedobacter defluvii TaxID=2045106 RepID=A0ABQ1ML14_9SPHI|nr:sigma-70 family RNA polymerase sigma factor [Parapedobacter defluvii]GGC41607.1 DNA-directed RNA polymerase sigma-70 factor [Parapedobacter defluvii]
MTKIKLKQGENIASDDELREWQHLVAYHRDEQAYRRLFFHFYPLGVRFCTQYLRRGELAEEAVADVMTNLWLMGKKLMDIQNLRVYVLKAFRNKALDYAEKNRKFSFQEELVHDMAADLQSPEERMISSEAVAAIDRALDSLPPKCRAVFLLVRETRCTYREAAEIMGIAENTVNRHIQTAIRQLAALLRL